MIAETSKYIESTGNQYSITQDGRIYRHSFVDPSGALRKGRWVKPQINIHGYVMVALFGKTHSVHRLVANVFIPNPESKREVNHIDGIKTNNHVSNLEWCTRSENAQHAVDTGLMKMLSGESCPSAKLSSREVREIRSLYATGLFLQKELAKDFNTHPSNISYICSGKSRKSELNG